jgi:hypothetical protein
MGLVSMLPAIIIIGATTGNFLSNQQEKLPANLVCQRRGDDEMAVRIRY